MVKNRAGASKSRLKAERKAKVFVMKGWDPAASWPVCYIDVVLQQL